MVGRGTPELMPVNKRSVTRLPDLVKGRFPASGNCGLVAWGSNAVVEAGTPHLSGWEDVRC